MTYGPFAEWAITGHQPSGYTVPSFGVTLSSVPDNGQLYTAEAALRLSTDDDTMTIWVPVGRLYWLVQGLLEEPKFAGHARREAILLQMDREQRRREAGS